MSQRDKPRLALNNITAGVREREDANRTRVAGHLDEIQGVVASTLKLLRDGAVGFIDWLDLFR
jgi:putative aminopeptidase FrvX